MRYCTPILPWILVAFLSGQDDYERAIRSQRYTEKGKELTRIGDVEGAIMDFDEAIRLDPDNDEAYVYRGKAKAKRKGLLIGICFLAAQPPRWGFIKVLHYFYSYFTVDVV